MNYYVSSSKYLSAPERGSFAVRDFTKGEVIGIGVEIPRTYTRPDIEWKMYELIKMTNHSDSQDNLDITYKTDRKGTLIVYLTAKRPIEKDEEFLLNYMSLPFADRIDLSFLDINADKYFLYHYLTEEGYNIFKEHGLCSPRRLYDYNKDLYMKYVYNKYIDDASYFFDQSDHAIEALPDTLPLAYLDRVSPKFISSESVYFSLIPLRDYHRDYFKNFNSDKIYEVKIDALKLERLSNIVLIEKNNKMNIPFEMLLDKECKRKATEEAKRRPEVGEIEEVPYVSFRNAYFVSKDLFNLKVEVYSTSGAKDG